ncbi:hypothetical protein C6W84_1925 [Acinetobacter baumannii]|nr:hypothetical protein C6W84_1925 [Acinetobacter baumannii]
MMEWLQLLLPAWIMGTLLVFLTAPLGCLMLWRRMSFLQTPWHMEPYLV